MTTPQTALECAREIVTLASVGEGFEPAPSQWSADDAQEIIEKAAQEAAAIIEAHVQQQTKGLVEMIATKNAIIDILETKLADSRREIHKLTEGR